MKILYIAQKYDYGKLERGFSFEHYNFYDSLVKMDNGKHEIAYFPFDEIIQEFGENEMNKKLIEVAFIEKPDLCFFFLFQDEIHKNTIRKITEAGIVTFNWFADDHWRFDNFSKYYAPLFSWVSTTDSLAPAKYQKMGYKNVIKTQWACNHFLYKLSSSGGDYKYDVSFVGQPHGNRRQMIKMIENTGIKVDCFGNGWLYGRIDQSKMIKVFNTSKINLNLTKSSGGVDVKSLVKIFFAKNNNLKINSPRQWIDQWKSFLGKRREQIKGRDFEIPGCGGFLLSGRADNLNDYYEPDKEIVCYDSVGDLINKIKYYLAHEEERKKIARVGYERTINEHTYEKRFRGIFNKIGFQI